MLNIAALILQIGLFIGAAFVLPYFGPIGLPGFLRYTLYSILLWGAYTIVAIGIDILLGTDTPGAGYLALGFMAFLLGSFLCFLRWLSAPTSNCDSATTKQNENG